MGMLGSPRYMSPEQVNEEELTHQCDIFSLGVVAYELVTGTPPFVGKTIAQLVRAIVESEPVPVGDLRPDVPAALPRVIAKALAKETSNRYEYAHEMAADLASLFGQLDHTASAPSEEARFAQVRALAFFNEFSAAELQEVMQASSWHFAESGTVLLGENTPASAFYIIVRGAASVRLNDIEIARLVDGECFGEMAVLSGKTRGATVLAIDQCTLLRVDSRHIKHASTACRLRFTEKFLQTLVERLSLSNERQAQLQAD